MIPSICPPRYSGFIQCIASSSRTVVRRKGTAAASLFCDAAALPDSRTSPILGHGRFKGKSLAGHSHSAASTTPGTTSYGMASLSGSASGSLSTPYTPTPSRHPPSSLQSIGSYRLFATRTQMRPLSRVFSPPSAEPILARLPPLPAIHDLDLALAATDISSKGDIRPSYKLALLGDALLAERSILAVDKAGMTTTSGDLAILSKGLLTNNTLAHLAVMYGLHTILRIRGPVNIGIGQYQLGSAFEAWMAAAWLDARIRGPGALNAFDQALEQLFSLETWTDLQRILPVDKADVFTSVPAGQRMCTPISEIGAGSGRARVRVKLTGHPARDFLEMRKESAMRTYKRSPVVDASDSGQPGTGATFNAGLGTTSPSVAAPETIPVPATPRELDRPVSSDYQDDVKEALRLLAEAQSAISVPLMAPFEIREKRRVLEDSPSIFLDDVRNRIEALRDGLVTWEQERVATQLQADRREAEATALRARLAQSAADKIATAKIKAAKQVQWKTKFKAAEPMPEKAHESAKAWTGGTPKVPAGAPAQRILYASPPVGGEMTGASGNAITHEGEIDAAQLTSREAEATHRTSRLGQPGEDKTARNTKAVGLEKQGTDELALGAMGVPVNNAADVSANEEATSAAESAQGEPVLDKEVAKERARLAVMRRKQIRLQERLAERLAKKQARKQERMEKKAWAKVQRKEALAARREAESATIADQAGRTASDAEIVPAGVDAWVDASASDTAEDVAAAIEGRNGIEADVEAAMPGAEGVGEFRIIDTEDIEIPRDLDVDEHTSEFPDFDDFVPVSTKATVQVDRDAAVEPGTGSASGETEKVVAEQGNTETDIARDNRNSTEDMADRGHVPHRAKLVS